MSEGSSDGVSSDELTDSALVKAFTLMLPSSGDSFKFPLLCLKAFVLKFGWRLACLLQKWKENVLPVCNLLRKVTYENDLWKKLEILENTSLVSVNSVMGEVFRSGENASKILLVISLVSTHVFCTQLIMMGQCHCFVILSSNWIYSITKVGNLLQ